VSPQDDESMFRADPLRSFCQEVFVACGMAREDAFIVADGLVQSNLRRVDSHGVASNPGPLSGRRRCDVGEDCGAEMGDFESRATGDDLH
jgi:LDH2 family malate/lactate/ureidoglycolate dehydrogenase